MLHRKTTLSILILCLFFFANAYSQQTSLKRTGHFTPGGYLDTVFDYLGNRYSLAQIAIDNEVRRGANGPETAPVAMASCTSGYFQMYLETGCGMEGTDPASVARLNVLCQVLSDISAFLTSPCTASGQKINIWVRNISSFSGGFLGLATSFYNVPYSTTASGIADNALWITLNSGTDAYKNVATGLSTIGGGTYGLGPTLFHGVMAFRCDPGVHWHTDLSTPPSSGEYDLYSVAMHEITHSLGFASMINYDGNSRLGAGYHYYTRYDKSLQTPSGIPLLSSTTPSCDLYNYIFNPALTASSVLSPGSTAATCPSGYQTGPFVNHTECANAVKYVGGTTQPVYTPSCYEPGSSLSHFEDECSVAAGFVLSPPGSNDQYFLMSNVSNPGAYNATTNPGAMKRCPRPEERSVLCDIGYQVNTTYGSAAHLNNYDYGGAACGTSVAGINDGITTTGAYAFVTNPGVPVDINAGTSGTSLLANDYGVSGGSFKCLEVVRGLGTLSATSGTSTTLVKYTPDFFTSGLQLLRYIPLSASGVEGNVTYVYVFAADGNCTPSTCDYVMNGDFEGAIGIGCGDISILATSNCWTPYVNSPDLMDRGAGTVLPDCGLAYDLPNIYLFLTATDVHPFSHIPNNHCSGMFGYPAGTSGAVLEGLQEGLAAPLTPGTYQVSFWAIMANKPSYVPIPTHVEFGVSPSLVPLTPPSGLFSGFPSGITSLAAIPVDHPLTWHYYSRVVTYSGPPASRLAVIHASYLNPSSLGSYMGYILVDDISIKPVGTACLFAMPDTICLSSGLLDLSTTVNIPGGAFSWFRDSSGFAVPSHNQMLDPLSAYNASLLTGDTGTIAVCYTYTDVVGCIQTVCGYLHILNLSLPPITGTTNLCVGATTALADATTGGTWSVGYASVVSTAALAGVVTGLSAGTALVTYKAPSGCTTTIVVSVDPYPIAGITMITIGGTTTLTSATTGGTWSSNNPAVATVGSSSGIVTGIAIGTTIVSYTTVCGVVTTVVSVNFPAGIGMSAGGPSSVAVVPNPTSGVFSVTGTFAGVSGYVTIEMTDIQGRRIFRDFAAVKNGMVKKDFSIDSRIANGIYFIKVKNDEVSNIVRITLQR